MYCVGLPIIILLVVIALINVLQNKKPQWLPGFLQTWDFVPLPLRSLAPYDKIFTSPPCCRTCRQEHTDALGLQDPTTVQTISTISGHSSDDLGKAENGGVTLVEARAFYPVGPVTQGTDHLTEQK